MKAFKISYPAFFCAALATVISSGCKGRTADNVVPTGDTAEVIIDSTEILVSEAIDSLDSSNPSAEAPAHMDADELKMLIKR